MEGSWCCCFFLGGGGGGEGLQCCAIAVCQPSNSK